MRTLGGYFLVAFALASMAQAQIPHTLSYQGILTDTLGNPRPDGSYTMTFRLYQSSSGGSAIWSESKSLQLKGGLFSTSLGDATPFPGSLLFDTQYWLSVQVGAGAELAPRTAMTATPYSLASAKADSARITGGVAANAVTTSSIADNAVTSAKIQNGSIQFQDIGQNGAATGQVMKWNGSAWTAGNDSVGNGGTGQWSLTGNAGTVSGTNFVGTTDAQAFDIRTNNILRTRITTKGQIETYNTGQSTFLGEGAGASDDLSLNLNTFVGYRSGFSNDVGVYNTAIGYKSLYTNTDGDYNTALGLLALYGNTLGGNNTADGYLALGENSTGSLNTASGSFALQHNSTGYHNTAAGFNASLNTSTGFENTSVGSNSLVANTTGSYNTALGYNTGSNSANLFNTTCIGIDATATASDMVRIGNVYVNSIGGQVGWTTLSDGRFKENVKEDVPGLSFITKLRPVTYRVNRERVNDFLGVNERRSKLAANAAPLQSNRPAEVATGFIAQEVEETAHAIGFDFSGVDSPKSEKDMYGLRYAEFVVPLVKAVQEQQRMIQELKKRIEELEKR
jgi:hypothetical protein